MTVLSDYITQLQNLLNDPLNQFSTEIQKTYWINQARHRIAGEAQCVRVLTQSSGSLSAISVTAGGSGYTSATVTISSPDAMGVNFTQATATATVLAGAVTAINITNPGTGYVNTPTITISGDGAGATASATLTSFWKVTANQETYTYAAANAIITAYNPGVSGIFGVQSVAVAWGAMKPVLRYVDWSSMQAYMRSINYATSAYPAVWSQYKQGQSGNVYLYPIPSQTNQMEWDCYCDVIDLTSDSDVEAIPSPFTDAVPLLAAYYAYLKAQRRDDANWAVGEYKRFLREGRMYTTPSMNPDFYPNW